MNRLIIALGLSSLTAFQIASRLSLGLMAICLAAPFLALLILLTLDRWAKTPLSELAVTERTFRTLGARKLVFKNCVFDEISASRCTIQEVSFQRCRITRISSDELRFENCQFQDVELGALHAKQLSFTNCHFFDCRLFGAEQIPKSCTSKCTGDDASIALFSGLQIDQAG